MLPSWCELILILRCQWLRKRKVLTMSRTTYQGPNLCNRHNSWIWIPFPPTGLSWTVTGTPIQQNHKILSPSPSWNSPPCSDGCVWPLIPHEGGEISTLSLTTFLLKVATVRVGREYRGLEQLHVVKQGFSFIFNFEHHEAIHGSTKWTSSIFAHLTLCVRQQGLHS